MWPWASFLSSHKNLQKVLNDLMLQIKSNKLQKIENCNRNKRERERGTSPGLTWQPSRGPAHPHLASRPLPWDRRTSVLCPSRAATRLGHLLLPAASPMP